ncbi:MAG: hypothetical protein SOR78_07685 [Baileyella intestinalis]|uniref:hypothetical protein n=1 Tax=Baileyella intestinalis TaxID=2606709 RepID=UPI002A7514E6|nr:hypothetical protein [Baileyella intestinalis]MCI7686343.1 hypothetical protein [Clostridiales bacterium]MDY2995621.1 hypothetical protein [Baileyella intestinalis]
MADITLIPLAPKDHEQFILDNQEAFNCGALEEFVRRNEEFEEDDQIISKDTIQQSIYSGEAYRILEKGRPVGGVIIQVDGERGDLDLFEKRMDSSYKTDPLPQRLDK